MNDLLPRRKALTVMAGMTLSATGLVTSSLAVGEPARPQQISSNELINSGHRFFGTVSRDLALAIQNAVSRWGEPNGYILGQEGSGAFIGGLRYGEGTLFTRNVGDRKVYWQGPSVGWDFGGDGARTMMLVYNMARVDEIFSRFPGIAGSAYIVGGFGMTALGDGSMMVVPIKSGVGARLGINLGYLKFTPSATWNPF
ncbi:hypothetical protein GCM10007874_69120 [Labrys miyagiensis]|uniref:DUF1134 domain-containing protein n=1 Tax=Labrys miyagiensis TaxID=346912 RepID=A0ABQ6CU55_9HYPH|nr:DUF1134 domain-containing protein [Labrys miyagiensis]GLS23891.1 hypothetical protein GCM10007874_69120 [Labrys miyagiensis]